MPQNDRSGWIPASAGMTREDRNGRRREIATAFGFAMTRGERLLCSGLINQAPTFAAIDSNDKTLDESSNYIYPHLNPPP